MNKKIDSAKHFAGKTIPEHLKEARKKGFIASSEAHGVELSGSLVAYTDTAKETTILLTLLFFTPLSWPYLLILGGLWALWKTIRSAMLGNARIDRLHKLIEEERWEIEHHREQEKEELKELYQAKGLQGKLLDDTVEVLMADDNRLLQVMLEEELGLTLEAYEHPLRQACGALLGALTSLALLFFPIYWSSYLALYTAAAILIITLTTLQTKQEKTPTLAPIVWNLASLALLSFLIHNLIHWIDVRL